MVYGMVLEKIDSPLVLKDLPKQKINKGQLLIDVEACGVCRTDLHVVDGELPHPKVPIIPGHQIVGKIKKIGKGVTKFSVGQRVGVPWLGGCCGVCRFCTIGKENLCDNAVYTGYQVNGGFAEECVTNSEFCFPLPDYCSPTQIAPLLCGGLIGYRALKMTEDAKRIGFFGFGAAAHILIQVCLHQKRQVYAFTRPGDTTTQKFALKLGAVWAGDSNKLPPQPLDAAILFAPIGALVPQALKSVDKGGVVVCAGIHMSDIPSFPYSILWEERILRSVANLTKQDGIEFLALAPKIPIRTEVTTYPLSKANEALQDLRNGTIKGSAVIQMS